MIEVEYINSFGDDLSVVNAARVSFAKQSDWAGWFELAQGDAKLIDYLAKHNHKSPFNHQFFSFRVKAPIFVARQLVKHEYLPWNEVSRRYVEDNLEFYIPSDDDWRSQPEAVKQGSGEPLDQEIVEILKSRYKHLIEDSQTLYRFAIENGLSREQARMVLPQSLMTEWIWSGSFYAFVKMCHLRLDPHAQKESGVVAEQVKEYLEQFMPVSTQALLKYIGEHK